MSRAVAAVRAVDPLRAGVHWGIGHALPRMVMRRAARRGDLQGRLIIEGLAGGDVLDLVEEVRASGSLHRSELSWLTADHGVVREVLGSGDFRSGNPAEMPGLVGRVFNATSNGALHPLMPPSLLVTEPPDHTRYRKLVTRVFTVRAVEQLRARTEEIAARLLDGLAGAEPVELVERYCAELPVAVIAEILGVPERDRARVLAFGTAAAPSLDLGLDWRTFRRVERGLAEFDTWLGQHLERLRREPGDNLLSRLVAARDEQGALNDVELRATAGLVLAAGFETTVNLLGNGIRLLTDHPDQLELLRSGHAEWSNAADEVLRLDPPVLLTGRMSTADVNVGGRDLPQGSMVVTLLVGANRDPAVFPDPLRFDVTRENARDHVAFSAGRHYCLGASLARMEGEVGLRAIFERFPGLQLLPGARRRATRILRGYETLPARVA